MAFRGGFNNNREPHPLSSMIANRYNDSAHLTEENAGRTSLTKVLYAHPRIDETQLHRSPVFAFLSPTEKGFFTGVEGGPVDRNSMEQFYECLATRDIKKIHKWIDDRGLPLQFKAGKK